MANLVSPLSGIPAKLAEIQAAYRRLPPPNQLAWYDELMDISSRIGGVIMILEKVRTDVNAEADTIGRNSAANVLVGLSQNSNRNRSRNRNRVNNTRKTNSRQRYNRNYNANTESAFPVNYFNVTRVSQRKRK
jgi:hypothetical protein